MRRMEQVVAAVDVGTASVRAALFDRTGGQLGRGEVPLALARPAPGEATYRFADIWDAVAAALRAARAEAGVTPAAVAGLGIDATCSLVLTDRSGAPLGPDTLAWCDHRALADAAALTATGDPLLATLGGVVSPEMQIAKLAWLRRQPELWNRLGAARDLADALTHRATGNPARSLCTLAAKWTYQGQGGAPWRLDGLGLGDLPAHTGAAGPVARVGGDLGPLTPGAAAALGLTRATRVAAGMVDAHAGMLGMWGAGMGPGEAGLIAGTSSCLIAVTPTPLAGAGYWGPAHGAVMPGLWVTEGGQSASGALLDHLARDHPGGWAALLPRLDALLAAAGPGLAGGLHVLPDLLGRRTPEPDPGARAGILGLDGDAGPDATVRLVWRGMVALAVNLGEIAAGFGPMGAPVGRVRATGGHTRAPVLMQLYADALGVEIALAEGEAMLTGAAVAAAAAAGLYPDLAGAAAAMARPGPVVRPRPAPWLGEAAAGLRALRRLERRLRGA